MKSILLRFLSLGGYKEINENIQKAYDVGRDVKYVIRSLDYNMLVQDKDAYNFSVEYPTYLYNNNLLDDVNYILNKEVFLEQTWNVLSYTKKGYKTTDFDDYVNWNDLYDFGRETVLETYTLGEKNEVTRVLTAEEGAMILDNITQNVTELADKHPETIFYLFFPPYSICYWDGLQNGGMINWRIDAEKIAIEEILKYPNIKLYSFCNNFEMVCNLDNYKDRTHYGEWVNSWMLSWMKEEKYLLTKYNYQAYIDEIRAFYNSYDYNLLRE